MGTSELALSSHTKNQSNDDLGNEITLLAGQINAANYRFLKLIAEFDSREAWAGDGIQSCAHWLNWKCGIALGAAREKVRVARSLGSHTQIDNAFSSGSLSFSKVRAMTRVATNENEDFLLKIAKHGTASHIEKLVRKFKTVEHPIMPSEQPKQKQDPEQARKMVSYQDDDGMWNIHAKLPAEVGALVVKAIDAILKEQQPEKIEEDVSAETSEDETEKVPYEQRRVDALATMAEHYLATATNGDGIKHLAGNERCQVMLHVDINTLKEHAHDHHHEHCNLDNKHWIAPETAKRLCCDASLVTVLEDEKGNVLNIGRRSRTIPPSIQRALNLRDTSCQYPGCCSTNYLDAHHIKHWADGGETNLDNLVTLCRKHHRNLHKGEFSIETKQSELLFKTAKGKCIEQSIYPQFAESTSVVSLKEQYPNVGKNTAVTKWQGEAMDYDMAVSEMLG